MYANNIVLIAPTANSSQRMIVNQEVYCDNLNLRVNLSKSKIMVFKKRGKIKNNKNWYFKRQRVEVVDEYKYLGVVI